MNPRIDSLLEWYAMASDSDRAAGLDWYPEADALAGRLAESAGITHLQACGVIAVLSPQCSWPDNKRAAVETVNAWSEGRDPSSVRVPGALPANVRKAFQVLDLDTFGIDGHGVCDGCRVVGHFHDAPLHGPKVCAFWRAIAGTASDGAMDVWACRAALVTPDENVSMAIGENVRHPVPTGPQYARVAQSYRDAADRAGVDARSFQAVVWLCIRRNWLRADGRINGVRTDELPF